MTRVEKSEERKEAKKEDKETLDAFRKPATMIPPTKDEFRIVSPDPHEPSGQTTHE